MFEHLQAVQARIAEIERKFGSVRGVVESPGASSFKQVMRRTCSPPAAPCPTDLEPVIQAAAAKYGVDAAVVKGVIQAESGFNANAVSPVGARGLMQLMPGTARALGVDPSDPEECIDGGTKYLKQMIDRFGSLESGLAAYNAGPSAVTRYGGVPPYTETQNYVRKVVGYIDQY